MKNLFDYATKELSQDAFLRWLFENHDDPEIGEISNQLLGKFCGFHDGEKVQSLETVAQWCKIDISVWITTTLGRKIALFIEDKTFSNEHSQLRVYDNHIDGVKEHEIYKVFYKTDLIEGEEKSRISAAKGWIPFDIKEIYSFWSIYQNADNIILSQYAKHIKKIYEAVTNVQKPTTNNNEIDFLAWKAYFINTVLPNVFNKGSCHVAVFRAGQYPYVCLSFTKRGYGEKQGIPYLEIQSRDCRDNHFKARILCYGIGKEDISQQQVLIENIKLHNEWECKNIITRKKGQEDYIPKQVGFSRDGLLATTDEEFITLVEKYIEYYLQVMKDWL